MSASDHAAFQRAVAADPADLTTRLVYADFLEETGDPAHAARAGFIRAQIEADGLPRNDPRRVELTARAERLFAAHWVEWWAPVCEAVGLPPPLPSDGRPYRRWPSGCSVHRYSDEDSVLTRAFGRAEFHRGWPEMVAYCYDLSGFGDTFRRWAASIPLRGLGLRASVWRDWLTIGGEHLRHVSRLALTECHTEVVRETLSSAFLPGLTALEIRFDTVRAGWGVEQIRTVAESAAADRLESLTVGLTHLDEATVFAPPGRFGRLTELTVRTDGLHNYGEEHLAGAIVRLARAACAEQLMSLTLGLGRHVGDRYAHPLHPTVESAIVELLKALNPERLRFLDIDGTQHDHWRIARIIAARFGDKAIVQ